MSLSSMRPTFEVHVPQSCDLVVHQFGEALEKSDWKATSKFFGRYAELHVAQSEMRYWSPHLSLYFDADGEKTRILGRFGPRQEVWTFVCMVYLALAFSAFFSLVYTYSLWMLGEFTILGIVPPIAVGGIGLLYLASRVGQNWSSDQMMALRAECKQLFQQAFPTVELN